jgi:acetyl esterase/lipase
MAGRILAPPSEGRRSLLPGIDGPVIELAVADGRRAMQLVRSRSADFGIDPDKVAMVGFSAGAVLTMQAAVAEDAEERPDLAVVVYGGAPSGPVPDDAPPALFIAAADDPLLGLLTGVPAARQAAGRPTELHLYERGGHGFGMQRRRLPVDSWPDRMWEWLESHRFGRGGSG